MSELLGFELHDTYDQQFDDVSGSSAILLQNHCIGSRSTILFLYSTLHAHRGRERAACRMFE